MVALLFKPEYYHEMFKRLLHIIFFSQGKTVTNGRLFLRIDNYILCELQTLDFQKMEIGYSRQGLNVDKTLKEKIKIQGRQNMVKFTPSP